MKDPTLQMISGQRAWVLPNFMAFAQEPECGPETCRERSSSRFGLQAVTGSTLEGCDLKEVPYLWHAASRPATARGRLKADASQCAPEATLEDAVNVFSLALFPYVNLDLKKTLPVLRS